MKRWSSVAAVVAFLLTPAAGVGQTADVIHDVFSADDDFHRGMAERADAAEARPWFHNAATQYDAEWALTRPRTPQVAANRGRAHFLAGDLPGAIRAFRDGLDVAPWDADLQRGLASCRAAVAYPSETTPGERIRPEPTRSLRHRVSPVDLLAAGSVFAFLTAAGLARRLTVAEGWGTPAAVVGAAGLAIVAVIAVAIERDIRQERAHPVVVVTEDAVLRTGNGPSFLPRIELPLPRGAEIRELGRRGGWVQVEVPGGAVGWVPDGVVLASGADSGGPVLGPAGRGG